MIFGGSFLSSWRDFKPYHEPSLWRRQKGHKGCDLNTDPDVFPYLRASSLEWLTSGVFLPTPSVSLVWHSEFTFEPAWTTGAVSAFWKYEQWSHWGPLLFLRKKGSNNPRVYPDIDTGFHLFFPFSPNKTGKCYNPIHLFALDPQTPHSEMEDFYSPNMTKTKIQNLIHGCYQMQQHLQDNGSGGQSLYLKGWIIQHQQPWEQLRWWQGV